MAVMRWLGPYIPANVASSPSVTAFAAVVLFAATTRLLCRLFLKSRKGKDGTWSVGMVPYWFPILGHIPAMMVHQDTFVRKLRDASVHGILAVNLGGITHNLAYTPSLIRGVFAQNSTIDHEGVMLCLLNRFFGSPRSFNNKLCEISKDLNIILHRNLMREPGLGKMLARTTAAFEEHIPNLVSFTTSTADWSPWERAGDVNVIRGLRENGEPDLAVEANLFQLLRNLMGHLATPSLMGKDFVDNYPEALRDLWDLDGGFWYFLGGFPQWLPIPRLRRAVRARDRLLQRITDFHIAMDIAEEGGDPGSEWRDFSDISDVVRERHQFWRANKVPPHLRADLALIWAMNVNANTLCFWMIVRIMANPGLLDRLRAELEPHVQATQPEKVHSVAEPPKLKISIPGVRTQCPLLKSIYFESLRLDSGTWSIKRIVKDFTITEDKGMLGRPRSFALKAGEYVDVPSDVHQSDPRYFPSPEQFTPDRFLVQGPNGKVEADIGTLRPYGGGPTMCKGKLFAEAEVLTYVAGIIALWDFEPTSPEGWKIPGHVRSAGVCLPEHDVRVRVTRRRLV